MADNSTQPVEKKRPGLLRQVLGMVVLIILLTLLVNQFGLLSGCRPTRTGPQFAAPGDRRAVDGHPARGPHGGTLGVIGDEAAHVELLHDSATGTLTIHILGRDATTPMQYTTPSLPVTVRFGDETRTLDLKPIGTAQGQAFQGRDPWLRGKSTFIVKLPAIMVASDAVMGAEFDVPYPAGNDPAATAAGAAATEATP